MPLYEYCCVKCGEVQDHHHKMSDPVPSCAATEGCDGELERTYSPGTAPKVTRVKGSRIGDPWFYEREVHALHGKDWRETSKNPRRPGGARKALYFH